MRESLNIARTNSAETSAAVLIETPSGASLSGSGSGLPPGPAVDLAPRSEDGIAAKFVEVLTLLAERARHHGLAEVGHFLEVAALAASEAAGSAPPGGE